VKLYSSRQFRKELKAALLREVFENAVHLAGEVDAALDAAHSRVVSDGVATRSYASSPTENVALNGYGPPVDQHESDPSRRDRVVRGQAALRRQIEKSQRLSLDALVRCGAILDSESRRIEKAMGHLKPGASVRNPRFEVPVRGDTTLGKAEMMATLEAQERRRARGEMHGG